MAEKVRSCQIHIEAKKSREESNWKSVIHLAEQLKLRPYFLIGEGKLELSSSKYKQVEWDEKIVQCFEEVGDLTFLCIQE